MLSPRRSLMIRIAITAAAFNAVAKTLPLGTVSYNTGRSFNDWERLPFSQSDAVAGVEAVVVVLAILAVYTASRNTRDGLPPPHRSATRLSPASRFSSNRPPPPLLYNVFFVWAAAISIAFLILFFMWLGGSFPP